MKEYKTVNDASIFNKLFLFVFLELKEKIDLSILINNSYLSFLFFLILTNFVNEILFLIPKDKTFNFFLLQSFYDNKKNYHQNLILLFL